MLLSYHRRLRMIPEALVLSVEGGRVNHSWRMDVVGLVEAGMNLVAGRYARQSQGLVRM